MTPWTFRGYGVNSSQVTVVLERVTHWHPIDYNGNLGTEVYLDTGKSVRVGEYHADVEKAFRSTSK